MAGISVQYIDGQLFVSGLNEFGVGFRSDISSLLVLGNDLEKLLKPIIDEIRLKRLSTIKSELRHLSALGDALRSLGITSLPMSESGWQLLVRDVHHFIITRPDSKASLQSRVSSVWMATRGFFGVLVEAGVIPVSIYLPPGRETLGSLDISAYQDRLIGQKASVKIDALAKIDKLICSVSLARTDAEYLDELRDTLAARRSLLYETLLGHWKQVKANFEFGRQLREKVVWDEIKPLVDSYPLRKISDHPANPRTGLTGLANYLAVIQNKYHGVSPSDDDLRNLNQKFEYIPRFNKISPITAWADKYILPDAPYGREGWSERNVLWWWQGRLSHFDVSIISALLIMLHPSWTPSSIILAKISNRDGKKYLDLSDKGHSYEVDKPRAKAMKMELLDPLAYEIISTLIQEGQALREELGVKGDPKASLLFIPYGRNKVAAPIPSQASEFLSGSRLKLTKANGAWIGAVYPELLAGGLGLGTLSFAKIRSTEGVLEWFRTKSLRAVARKLGNTEKVVLQHYIPKPILDAWNTRMIRRFQNLWISVAVANENFLLDVSDFSSLSDLHAFLKDILQLHAATDSPLAEMAHRRFNARLMSDLKFDRKDAGPDGHLHVAISKGALSALYTYQANILNFGLSDAVLDKKDVITGISPRDFLFLTDLLQSQLPEDKNPEYVDCHFAALKISSDYSLRHKWSQLFKE